jgi:hypothetical protein
MQKSFWCRNCTGWVTLVMDDDPTVVLENSGTCRCEKPDLVPF